MLAVLARTFVRTLYWVNGLFPGAKSLVPKSLHRFVLLRIVGVNEGYEEMLRQNPERLFLQNELFPWVRDNYRQVLFVGTASYTHQYEFFFRDRPDDYTTIDRNPSVKVWGSKHHIVAPIGEIAQHRPPEFFDCIILNGVLGYSIPSLDDIGVVGTDDIAALMRTLRSVLKPGGLLVVGWNTNDMPVSAYDQGLVSPAFSRFEGTPWGPRREFAGDPHVVEFYARDRGK